MLLMPKAIATNPIVCVYVCVHLCVYVLLTLIHHISTKSPEDLWRCVQSLQPLAN